MFHDRNFRLQNTLQVTDESLNVVKIHLV